jgi:hypothetical protein
LADQFIGNECVPVGEPNLFLANLLPTDEGLKKEASIPDMMKRLFVWFRRIPISVKSRSTGAL